MRRRTGSPSVPSPTRSATRTCTRAGRRATGRRRSSTSQRTARGWEALSEIQRKSALWTYSMFFYGEDSVTDNLSPYIDAAPKEEQKYFLATQQVDEARHSVFFHRFFKEVIGAGEVDRLDARLHRGPARLGLPERLRPPRPDGRGAPPRPLAPEVRAGHRPLPHGRRSDPGPARAALHRGLLQQGRHDARVQRGHAQRLPRRAAPHRLRRQDPGRVLPRVGGVQGRRCRDPARGHALLDGGLRPAGLGPRVHALLRLRARGHLRLRDALGGDEVEGGRLPDRGDALGRLSVRPLDAAHRNGRSARSR